MTVLSSPARLARHNRAASGRNELTIDTRNRQRVDAAEPARVEFSAM